MRHALLADERNLREIAREEGVGRVVGSLWLVERLCERRVITKANARDIPRMAKAQGYFYRDTLLEKFDQQIESLPGLTHR